MFEVHIPEGVQGGPSRFVVSLNDQDTVADLFDIVAKQLGSPQRSFELTHTLSFFKPVEVSSVHLSRSGSFSETAPPPLSRVQVDAPTD